MPILFVGIFLYGFIKKIHTYDTFVKGAKGAIELAVSIFPYIAAIMIAVALLRVSGVTDFLAKILVPVFEFFVVPSELCELILLRPFTGSGSYALARQSF